ncbi:MAG: DUF3060 domain-containing protein [Archangiaceae bacterium]|nr:DUF3060 domain-containing protein [Archangiaceae bacterium]
MRTLFVTLIFLTSTVALAQQVKVQTGSGEVQVETGGTAVQVNAQGTSVKTGKSGKVNVKAGQTTVQTDGQAVRVETKPGTVTVNAPAPAAQPAVVVQPAPATEVGDDDEDLVIQDDSRTLEHTCGADQQIIVNGDSNVLTFHGPCKDLHVNGARNRITIDSVQAITANGDSNQIQWAAGAKGKNPKVSSNGNRNTVSKLR